MVNRIYWDQTFLKKSAEEHGQRQSRTGTSAKTKKG